MISSSTDFPSLAPAMQTHLLGLVDYSSCLALQQRLVYETAERDDGQIVLLICEHPNLITIGRGGSVRSVAVDCGPVRHGQLITRWVNRGGGCLLHAPGQLALYPIVPLRWHGLSVGRYLDCLQSGIIAALTDVGIAARGQTGRHGVWGRTGQLASLGVAVRNWITYHGAFVNVSPPTGLLRIVENDSPGGPRMSSLVAERGRAAKMHTVRAAIVHHLAEALGCDRYHLHTGHPLLKRTVCPQVDLGD